jgi:hypothetical protein
MTTRVAPAGLSKHREEERQDDAKRLSDAQSSLWAKRAASPQQPTLFDRAQSPASGDRVRRRGENDPLQSGFGERGARSGDGEDAHCQELGTRYRSLSADAPSAHGLSPQFVIHDELGQVRGPRSALFEALENATGALEDPLSIIISTQAANDTDLLSALLDDALAGHDPHTIVRVYSAPPDADPFSEEAIRLANPAYDVFMNKAEVLGMAAAARRKPSREARCSTNALRSRRRSFLPRRGRVQPHSVPDDVRRELVASERYLHRPSYSRRRRRRPLA